MPRAAAYAPSRAEAEAAHKAFRDRYADARPRAVAVLEGDWDRMTASCDYAESRMGRRVTGRGEEVSAGDPDR
ncbi:hypothetical protein [Candidatus Palauibacter sp.]|uniref:hypothetical protein n=1 Tax=Candidatus Palauibacter sp. TaxID=3101350 RepID=UPI003B01DCC5